MTDVTAPANALHGLSAEGTSYVVLHDGTMTRYARGERTVSGALRPVEWHDFPAVASAEDAHAAGRAWSGSEGDVLGGGIRG